MSQVQNSFSNSTAARSPAQKSIIRNRVPHSYVWDGRPCAAEYLEAEARQRGRLLRPSSFFA